MDPSFMAGCTYADCISVSEDTTASRFRELSSPVGRLSPDSSIPIPKEAKNSCSDKDSKSFQRTGHIRMHNDMMAVFNTDYETIAFQLHDDQKYK